MASRVKRSKRAEYRSRKAAPVPDSLFPPNPRTKLKIKLHEDWQVNGVLVSDHAVVRYLENMFGVDSAAIRAAMVDASRADAIRAVVSGKIPIENNCRLIIRDGLVVTVVKTSPRGAKK
jgi:hypothetical protein